MQVRDSLLSLAAVAWMVAIAFPWTSLPPGRGVPPLRAWPLWVVDEGVGAVSPAEPGGALSWAGALLLLAAGAAIAMAVAARRGGGKGTPSIWLAQAAWTAAVSTPLLLFGHDEMFLHRRAGADVGWDLGVGMAGGASTAALATAAAWAQRRRRVALAPGRMRRHTAIVAGGLAASLAVHLVPLVQADVRIDSTRTYARQGGADIVGTMSFWTWWRTLPGHPSGSVHGWWDAFYLEKTVNVGLHAGGAMLVLATLLAAAALGWRARAFLFGIAALHVSFLGVFIVGAVGELGTDEYVAHGVLLPSWGILAWLAAVALPAWAAVQGPPPSAAAPAPAGALPPLPAVKDRNP